jgi:GT2 family glycosyltransferase
MKLSIVIVNWNSREFLRDCLLSVRSSGARHAPQVVVVDGGSFDGCGEMLAAEFPEVDFIQSQDNIGFGRCNNLGFSRVTGDLLLLLNPDTVLQEGALEALIDALETAPEAGMVGAHLLNSDGTLQLFGIHSLPTPLNCALDSDWIRRRWWNRKGPADTGPPVAVEAVSGACILMRSDTFRQVGGFSPQYFMYGEDMDLAIKVTRLGLTIYYAPDARVVHHGGGSSCCYRGLMALAALLRCALLASLLPFGGHATRQTRGVALLKWWTVLRWSLGLEKWASARFRESGRPVSLGAGACGLETDFSGNC